MENRPQGKGMGKKITKRQEWLYDFGRQRTERKGALEAVRGGVRKPKGSKL